MSNPSFEKNQLKLRENLADLLALRPNEQKLTPAERAAQLIASGKHTQDSSDSDKADDNDDEQMSFGIIPTKSLTKPDLSASQPTSKDDALAAAIYGELIN